MPRIGRDRKKLAYAALILVSLILAFAIILVPAMRSTVTFTTLSLSQVSVVSNDPTLNGTAFLMSASANQGGESAQGTWNPSATGQPKPFSITYDQQEQYCKYPIVKNTGSPVYTAWYLEENADTTRYADANAWCRSLTGTSTNTWAGSYCSSNIVGICTATKWWCMGLKQVGVTGTFQDIAFMWKGKVTVSSQSGTASGVVGGLTDQDSIVMPGSDNNPAVWVKWAGNLVSGTDCSSANPTTNIVPGYNSQTQQWNLGPAQALSQYQYFFNGLNTCVYSKTAGDSQGRQNCFSDMNAYATSIVGTGWNGIGNWATAAVDESNASTPFARINTGLIQFPVLQFKIKADWVGIYAPCGSPSITQYDGSLTGTATTSLTGTATTQNTGADSTMGATVTCPAGISANPINAFTSPANQSTQISYTVTSSQAVSGQCTLKIYDKNCPNNAVSKQFWVAFSRYCAVTCNGNFVLDSTNCACVCPLKSRAGYTIDPTNCAYVQIPAGSPGSQPQTCSLTCPNKYIPNSACNGCDCALDANKVPDGYTFNATACAYQAKPAPQPTTIDINLVLGVVAILAIFAGAYLWLRRRKGGRRG